MQLAERRSDSASRSEFFLDALRDPARAPIFAADVAVVVAHPDDETIGCGALLRRLRDPTIIMVTDGAPANLADARAYGFDTAQAYAAARRRELDRALAIAGVPRGASVRFEIPDQQSALALADLTCRLADLFLDRRVDVVLTHAFEGGHPDHDATAWAVHMARALLRARPAPADIHVVEMPLYHLGAAGPMRQCFADEQTPETVVALTAEERAAKQRMRDAHATQRATLAPFSNAAERFRRAPFYDLSALPNGGRLLYEQHDWGMTGERWRKLAAAAQRQLGSSQARGRIWA
jgi:LmbE family N-acetylglucosaminyl deacetylase